MRNPSFARWSIAFGAVILVGGFLLGMQGMSAGGVHCGSAFSESSGIGVVADQCPVLRDSRRLVAELVMLLGLAFLAAGVAVNDRRVWDGSAKDVRPVAVPKPGVEVEPEQR